MGEQHLGGCQAVADEGCFIDLDQSHLADGSAGLQFVHGLGALAPAKSLHATGDGARGDQHDLATVVAQLGDLSCPFVDGVEVQSIAIVGYQRGAHLDDEAFGIGEASWGHECCPSVSGSSGKKASAAVSSTGGKGASASRASCNA